MLISVSAFLSFTVQKLETDAQSSMKYISLNENKETYYSFSYFQLLKLCKKQVTSFLIHVYKTLSLMM